MTDEVQEQAFKDLMAELEAKRWTPLMNSDDVSSLSFNENALEGEGFPFSYENSLSLFTHRFTIFLTAQSFHFCPSFHNFTFCSCLLFPRIFKDCLIAHKRLDPRSQRSRLKGGPESDDNYDHSKHALHCP
jgi:hypothetical protein